MICSDFHPFTKIADLLETGSPAMSYFSQEVFEGEMADALETYVNDAKEENSTAITKAGDLVSKLEVQISKIDTKITELNNRISNLWSQI